ncbi:hypothetical protein ACVJMY_006661 [Bradyrhizobium diazoefficiens]
MTKPRMGGERAGGLARGKDDEVLVLVVVIELQLVILLAFVVLVVFEVRLGGGGKLVELGRLFHGGLLFVGRRRLGRHETNGC